MGTSINPQSSGASSANSASGQGNIIVTGTATVRSLSLDSAGSCSSAKNTFSGQLENYDDLLVDVLADAEAGAQADLMAIKDRIHANNNKKAALRELKNIITEMDALKKQRTDGDGKQIGDGEDTSAIEKAGLFDKMRKLIADNPWLEGSEIAENFNGKSGGLWQSANEITFKDRLARLEKSVDSETERLGDVNSELGFELQQKLNTLQRATELKSNISKRYHDLGMAIISNIKG